MEIPETQIVEYKKETHAALEMAQSLEVSNFEQVMDAADFLFRVKGIGERIAERKEEITRPLNEALKSARKLFKEIEDTYATAEQVAKEKVLDWHWNEWKDGRE